MRKINFIPANDIRLLHCGAEFFPALIVAIDAAEREVYVETYIFSHDATACGVKNALKKAAARGVVVRVILDWMGVDRPSELRDELMLAGVACRLFNVWFRRGWVRTHRKLCLVDSKIAFVGGINIVDDFIADDHTNKTALHPRWDFAVEVRGTLTLAVHADLETQWLRAGRFDLKRRVQQFLAARHQRAALSGLGTSAMLAAYVVRDNLRNRSTIQRAYLHALGQAHTRVIIANPYFAPGRKFRRALVTAAQRGVKVSLLVGVGEFGFQDAVTQSLYPKLLEEGIEIIEYRKAQLHAKVAIVDDDWATVGSSNMDGLSLFMNLEANVVIKDRGFAQQLRVHLDQGLRDGEPVVLNDYVGRPWHQKLKHEFAFWMYRVVMRIVALSDY
jgi:cardiolipin synthase A/B